MEYSSVLASIYLLNDETVNECFYSFVSKFFVVESLYKKLLIKYKKANSFANKNINKKDLRIILSEVYETLDYFDIEYEKPVLSRIFSSNNENFSECSIKKLRDRLAHDITKDGIIAIIKRHDQIQSDLDYFLSLVK